MKTLQWAAAALAVGALALPARAETTTTNDWWDVTFELDSFQQSFRDTYPEGLHVGELGILTNFDNASLGTVKPYASGQWSMIDGDESYVTNGVATNWVGGVMTEVESATYVKLDTQGNDLTWTPTNSAIELTTLVDADLYLVGSDSAPDTDDFDSAKDVQAAIYLKNEINEETGETTNSVLCVYVEHPVSGASYWQELKGVELTDNTWAHIQVMVDHSGGDPKVKVFVNGTQMTARDGDAVEWLAANKVSSVAAKKVNSVSFRGTGAVDNFAGKMLQTSYEEFDFSAEVYMNGTLVASDETGVLNKTQVKKDVTAKEPLTFEGFWLSNFDYTSFETTATWSLSKIEIVDAASHEVVSTIEYGWDVAGQAVTFDEENDAVYIPTDDDVGAQTGGFTVTVPTAGATSETDPDKPIVLARIYFEDLPEEGQFKLTASQNVGTAPADQTFNTNSLTVTEATFTYAQTLTVGETSYVLSKVVPGTAPAGAITVAYTSPNVVVTVPLTDQIAEGTYNVADATYVEGTIAEGKLVKLVSDGQGGYDLVVSDPPVAIIVADSGATTNEYTTLAAAVAAVQDGETVVLVSTIANESVHYTGTAAFTIDLNGQTWNYLDGENGNYAAFKNDGATVTFKDSSEAGTGKIYCNGDGFCIWSRTGSVVIESGSFVNKSPEDYAIYIGTDDANFVDGVPPTITITGGSFVNEDNAPYNNKPDWSRLVLNVMNSNATTRTLVKTELIQVSGGSYSWDPALGDDNMGGSFVAEGYKSVYDDTTGLYNVVLDVSTFEITFMNGATTLYTTQIVENAAVAYVGETPEKEATAQFTYTFAGWTNAVAGGPLYAGELPAAAGDTTYTAAFTETVNRYDVTFTVDGTTVATTNAPYGDTLYGPADPVKTAETGYEVAFAGWTNAVAGGATVTAANLPEVTGDATWAAVFTTTAIEYTVTVALDGGTLASGDSIPATYTVETAAFTLPTPTKEGFTFKGWVDGDNQPVTQIAGGTTGDISLTATWEKDSVEVHVNPGDGLDTIENAPAPIEFTAAGLCKIAFKAPAAGKYVLMTSTTVNGTYQAEGTPTAYEAGALVQLTETASAPTKFFKIGYEK